MRMAIVGAGPKAAAIAAKARVLNDVAEHEIFDITIFERDVVMSAWRGSAGYTDGEQPLCTLAERDLGFPYQHSYSREVAQQMMAKFSWHAFAVGKRFGSANYAEWVLRGRNPPSHRDFSSYTEAALQASKMRLRLGRSVTSIDYANGAWLVSHSSNPSGVPSQSDQFEAVVLTGSGLPIPGLNAQASPAHVAKFGPGAALPVIFDGASFWTNLPQVEATLRAAPNPRICLVGGGGTAAAIAHWVVRTGLPGDICIIGRSPTLYGRYRGYFEDRLFTDEDEWQRLSNAAKRDFMARQTSGVVWESVLQKLQSERVRYVAGSATRVEVDGPDEFSVVYDPSDSSAGLGYEEANVVVDARGFDAFASLKQLLAHPLAAALGPDKSVIEDSVTDSLELRAAGFPSGLHAPMLGSMQGPAAVNLMGLGWMADRVLKPYTGAFAFAKVGP